jgi:hypothetical protein
MTDLSRLLEALGVTERARGAADSLLADLRRSLPDVSDERWAAFVAELDVASSLERTVAESAKQTLALTHDETDQVCGFLESGGRRLLDKMFLVNAAMDRAANAWSNMAMRRLAKGPS